RLSLLYTKNTTGTGMPVRFELLAKIGDGATAVVYKARCVETGETVALKQFKVDANFAHELLIGYKVMHRNLCRVYDLVELDGLDCISMEFVDGGNLRDLLTLRAPLPLDEALP